MKSLLKVILVAATATRWSPPAAAATTTRTRATWRRWPPTRGFSALVAAADKAGLVPALSDGTASLTVFAPTDAAFDTLATSLGFADARRDGRGARRPDAGQDPDLPRACRAPGRSRDRRRRRDPGHAVHLRGATPATLAVDTAGGVADRRVLTSATVTTADVAASNGVIHVIDKVLVPPGVLNVVQMAQSNPSFSRPGRGRGRAPTLADRAERSGRPVHGVRADQRRLRRSARRTRSRRRAARQPDRWPRC